MKQPVYFLFPLFLLLLGISCHLQGQTLEHEDTHTYWLGGSVTFWQESKGHSSIAIHPEGGYLITPEVGVGMMLGYELATETREELWRVSPFVRYYYFNREPLNLYLDGGVGFSYAGEKNKEMHRGWEVGIRPGACVDLTEGLCLCLRLGFLGWRKDFQGGEEEGLSSTGFGIRFAPEELMVGLELEF